MARPKKPFNNPFVGLKLEAEPPKRRPVDSPPPPYREEVEDEAELFRRAVGEVRPVRAGKSRAPPPEPPDAASLKILDDEMEAFTRLCEMVAGEGPFDLSDSDEFVEGKVCGLDERIMQRLKQGEYSVQGHLDLHGLTREEAKEALEKFIQASRLASRRCVLVITGRGLHSKDQIPVLKESVQAWLTRGRIARAVLAFATARPRDGGAGAVYVLLRR